MSTNASSPSAVQLPPDTVIIDVRGPDETRMGIIQGALCLPLPALLDGIARCVPSPETPVVLYCASGARSGMAVQMMQQSGYQNVVNGGGIGSLSQLLQRPVVHP